jgi:proteasome lid subunit RPN8/RPN11
MLVDPEVERGGIISTEMEFIPFTNSSTSQVAEISHNKEDPSDWRLMNKYYFAGNLYGWVHSHPKWDPRPSIKDITKHEQRTNMVIYSVPLDRFAIYTTDEILQLKKSLDYLGTGTAPADWKPEVTKATYNKELLEIS